MAKDSPTQLVERVLHRAGLVDTDDRPLTTLHGLRHTGASLALRGNVPLIVVSRQLGHSRIDVTAKHYTHLLDDDDLDAFGDAMTSNRMREGMRGAPLVAMPDAGPFYACIPVRGNAAW